MNINGTCISSTTDEYGPIFVYQTHTSRILSFDGVVQQSRMRLDDINGLSHGYTRAMMTGLFFVPELKTATVMGLGAGSMVKNLLSSFTGIKVHAIEYRKAVATTARKYFHLPESDRLTIHIDDALTYIKHTDSKSDIIFSDLYNTKGMEPKQVHASYLRDCKNALNENGILALNIWNKEIQSQDKLEELLELEFENRLLRFEVETGNIIVLAFKNDIPSIQRKELLFRGKKLAEKMNIPLEPYAKLLWSSQKYIFGLK